MRSPAVPHGLPSFPAIPPALVEMYRESEWAIEASGITSFSKLRKRANKVYYLIDKSEIKGRKKRNQQRGEGRENTVLREDRVDAVTQKARTQL